MHDRHLGPNVFARENVFATRDNLCYLGKLFMCEEN